MKKSKRTKKTKPRQSLWMKKKKGKPVDKVVKGKPVVKAEEAEEAEAEVAAEEAFRRSRNH